MRNKVVAWILVLTVSMGISFGSFADKEKIVQDSTGFVSSAGDFDGLEVVRTDLDNLNVRPIPEMQEVSAEDMERSSSLEIPTLPPKNPLDSENLPESSYRLGRSTTNQFTDYITAEGESKLLYPIPLNPYGILQASMICPHDSALDYDLYLYAFDLVTGNLIPTPIDASILTTYRTSTDRTADEGVGTINQTGETQYYCIEVYAKKGSSATNAFTLTVSTDDYDPSRPHDLNHETNENPFSASKITAGQYVSGITLNVANDHDWYELTMPSDPDFKRVTISTSALDDLGNPLPESVYFELYGARNHQMVMIKPNLFKNNEKTYELSPGVYYICLTSDASSTIPRNYRLNTQLKPYAAKFLWDFSNDMDSPMQTGYPEGPGYWFENRFTITGYFLSPNGYGVADCSLDGNWTSEMWEHVPADHTRTASDTSDSSGLAVLDFVIPVEAGQRHAYIGGPYEVIHRYSINRINIIPQYFSDISGDIYHFFMSV